MTPNLFLATQTLFSPHKWFKSNKHARQARPVRTTEHWMSPVPGIYEYIPGRGWYLIATDKDPNAPATATTPPATSTTTSVITNGKGKPTTTTTVRAAPSAYSASDDGTSAPTAVDFTNTTKLPQPIQIKYSKVLKKHLLAPDYFSRKRHGRIKDDSNGRTSEAGFFRLDDGVAWVHCWDQHGEFIPGPYQLWFWDGDAEGKVGRFRHMRKGDDPEYVHSRNTSRANSRENSVHRKSQDSRSTQFRVPGGTASGGASRAGSLSGLALTSPSSSRNVSRPGSPKGIKGRSMDRTLSEATTLLNPIAAEQAARVSAMAVEKEKEKMAKANGPADRE